tara:strand:- start:945 stop:2096 length:1152 start_codon:yes stop_codon:yes gene_type:complete
MTIKNSGSSLSFSEIVTEFGNPTDGKFGNYRVTESLKRNNVTFRQLTLDGETPGTAGSIPTSGQIKFSDFYGKRLTNVIDIFSGGQENLLNAKKIFNVIPNRVTVVGPKKSSDRREADSKVIISVNKTVGSEKGDQTKCALRTGSWDSTVQLQVIVDGQGKLVGAGGDGGDGADGLSGSFNGKQGRGFNGTNGTSGLGIEHGTSTNKTKIIITSGGIISTGFGGGGGGAGGQETSKNDRRAGGGGGGGGAGIPAGIGGQGGSPQAGTRDDPKDNGDDGNSGSVNNNQLLGGTGGDGGSNEDQVSGANGGRGGDIRPGFQQLNGSNGGSDEGGFPNGGVTFGGTAGSNGKAIRKTDSNIVFEEQFSSNDDVVGDKDGIGVFQST